MSSPSRYGLQDQPKGHVIQANPIYVIPSADDQTCEGKEDHEPADVGGKKGDRKLHYKLWSDSSNAVEACGWIPGSNDVSWLTSIPASIFSLMLLRDQVGHTGVFPPEVFNQEERRIFFNGIKEWGINVHKQVQEIL